MPKVFFRTLRIPKAVFALAIACVVVQGVWAQSEDSESMLTYSRGQGVIPSFEGWHPNPDGTIDLWFGYQNRNYREEPDVPIGPDNNVSPQPYGPDAGQPTHFLPRRSYWVFAVRVPKGFDKEVVWTVTWRGKTYRAYATLAPGYFHDDIGMQREFFGEPPAGGNKPPEIRIEGDARRTVKVGQPSTLTALVTDDGQPPAGRRFAPSVLGKPSPNALPSTICGPNANFNLQTCGAPITPVGLYTTMGLRMSCFLYRGPDTRAPGDFGNAALVTFDPPQDKVYVDLRGGTPYSFDYTVPPIPKDNKWVVQTAFRQPGTYVIRCQAHDGLLGANQDLTFTVSP